MRQPAKVSAWFVFVALVSLSPLQGQTAAVQIDGKAGQINGLTALGVWPRLAPGVAEPGNPTGYEVVLNDRDDPTIEHRFAAGQWVMPPQGHYRMLLERPFLLSPWPLNFNWKPQRFAGNGFSVIRLVQPAGAVEVEAGACPPSAQCVAWLLNETSNIQAGPEQFFSPEMLRHKVVGASPTTAVQMPPGKLAVALYEKGTSRFLGLELPVEVRAGSKVASKPIPPAAGSSDLILDLARAGLIDRLAQDDVVLSLLTADGRRSNPAITTRTHRHILALWKSVPAGVAILEVISTKGRLANAEVQLRSGVVEYVAKALVPPPSLKVELVVPDSLRRAQMDLTVVDLSGKTAPLVKSLAGEVQVVDLASVPASQLEVVLTVGPWEASSRIDLTNGDNGHVVLEMQPIRLTGRVLMGAEPTPARLTFETRRVDWETDGLIVDTDSEGNFEALFAEPRAYFVLVRVKDRDASFGFPGIEIVADSKRDFELPSNRFRFQVVERATEVPVPGAQVVIRNVGDDGVSSTQKLQAGADGWSTAQPLRVGRIEVVAQMPGYVPSPAHQAQISEDQTDGEVRLEIEPLGENELLTLLLPNGLAAVGAEVLVASEGVSFWTLKPDAEGRVKVPNEARGRTLLIRAPGAALAARRWEGNGADTWRLEQPAPPLRLAVVAGETPATNTPAVLWLGDVRILGGPLAWLTGTPAGTDSAGFMSLNDLPAQAVALLFWKATNQNNGLVLAGALDTQRETIPYPWPSLVRLSALE